MRKSIAVTLFVFTLLTSCNKDEKILNTLNDYNTTKQTSGYHFGDKLDLPKEVLDNADKISISFGDKETSSLTVDPKFFTLGDNAVTFNITNKSGKVLTQDATINVFAKNPEVAMNYQVVKEYPHNVANFTEGLFLEGNTVYESVGLEGKSKLMKYTLGSTVPSAEAAQDPSVFSEGIAAVGNKIYQLTYRNKIGYIYDKNSLKLLSQFQMPNVMGEGWGLTTDGKYLIASDGTKNVYFLDPGNPSKLVKYISVAGNKEVYDQINELEYHDGFLYSNVWQKPIILKINPQNGEVVGKFDFKDIALKNKTGNTEHDNDAVLNGIAFKGENMLVTGKNWPKIYEVSIK